MAGQRMLLAAYAIVMLLQAMAKQAAGEECGSQAGGAECPGGLCCSQYGWCGTTDDYCTSGCQSNCDGGKSGNSPGNSPSNDPGNDPGNDPSNNPSNNPSNSPGNSPGGSLTGLASFYTAPYVPSACFGDNQGQFPGNMYFAAGGNSASANMWNNGENCGKWFKIQCVGNGCIGSGEITIKILDECPNGCSGGRTFDLSSEAFAAIADPDVGVITVNYWPA